MTDDVTITARAAIARGDLLAAYDLVRGDGLATPPAEHAYLAVLALARMGAVEEAERLYARAGLAAADDVDSRSLGARLLKDRALSAAGDVAALREATAAYTRIFEATTDPFPAINAATLSRLSGDTSRAEHFAKAALAAPSVQHPHDYYAAATKVEALLLLGRHDAAAEALHAALDLPGASIGARSTTLRQLTILAEKLGDDARIRSLLDILRPPTVAFYTGHIFRPDGVREAALAAQIDALIEGEQIGFGFGALAAGADILIAERLLAKGAEVHVLLPFAEDDFIAHSVIPAGADWLPRYERVRARAASVSFATVAGYVNDPGQFGYGARVAMGLARLRATHMGSHVRQLALWDGKPGETAGTGHDVATWQAAGGTTSVIDPGAIDRSFEKAPELPCQTQRSLRSLIFADFPNFTRIPETKLPAFWQLVMTAAGHHLQRFGSHVEFANSWGDALFIVVDTAETAAALALSFQDMLADIDPTELGLNDTVSMRVGVHFGPVYAALDVITGRINFFGSEVSRAARVEPMTPPGNVYVSEPFAAVLANEAPGRFTSTYVGNLSLPKGFGRYPLYALKRRNWVSE